MPYERKLKDFEKKNIRRLIVFLKSMESLIILTIGVLQFVIAVPVISSSTSSSNYSYIFQVTTTSTTTQSQTTTNQQNITLISLIFAIFFLGFMIIALSDILQRINLCIGDTMNRSGIWSLCCIFCLTTAYINTAINRCFQKVSIRECFWRTEAKLAKLIYFSLRLIVYLFGFSMSIAYTNLSTSNSSLFRTVQNVCVATLVLFIVRLVIMCFMFVYCGYFNPDRTLITHKNHEGFIRLEEMGTSTCSASQLCSTTDLHHILKCHDVLHLPERNCCYITTCRGDCLIGFHQTTPEVALLIAKTGFKCGSGGMYGGGIYFARTIDLTDRKALSNGAVICALVEMGKRYNFLIRLYL